MSDMHLQLSLFGGARKSVLPEPAPVLMLPAETAEPAVPEGQLGLFEGLSAHCARVALLARAAHFEAALADAKSVAANHQEARPWCAPLHRVAQAVESAHGDPEMLATQTELWGREMESAEIPGTLSLGILRGLYLATAEAAEQKGLGTEAGGRPAGWHWLQAGRVEEGRRSLEFSVSTGQSVGAALVALGNLAHREGDLAQARESYRRAFLFEPLGIRLDEISDEGVRELVDEAVELDLTPPEAWVPVVGLCTGVLANGPERSAVDEVAQFQDLLVRSRQATMRGTPDVAARRELKTVAPGLFPRLRDSGLI